MTVDTLVAYEKLFFCSYFINNFYQCYIFNFYQTFIIYYIIIFCPLMDDEMNYVYTLKH